MGYNLSLASICASLKKPPIFCLSSSAYSAMRDHELRLKRYWKEVIGGRPPIGSAQLIYHGVICSALCIIVNCLQKHRKDWKTNWETCHSSTETYGVPQQKACCEHALPPAQGDTCSSDAQWSISTSGGVCGLTPASQGNLTWCAAKSQTIPGEYKRKGEKERSHAFSWQRNRVLLLPR